jgi:hypothetical protein
LLGLGRGRGDLGLHRLRGLDRCRWRRGLLLRSRELCLQIRELGIAQLEQALRFIEFVFESPHAALQALDFGGARRGRTGARSVAGRHESQTAGVIGTGRRRPVAGLPADFVARFGG